MNCKDALAMMLEADANELFGLGRSPLSAHVASCERCGRVARTLREQTSQLQQNWSLTPIRHWTPRRNWSLTLITPVAVVAIAAVFFVMSRPADVTIAGPAVSSQTPSVETPAPVAPRSSAPTGRETDAPRRIEVAAMPMAVPMSVQPIVATLADEVSPASTDSALAQIRVTTQPGTRATIMRDRDARVTVVWIH